MAIADPRCCMGYESSITDWESGTSAECPLQPPKGDHPFDVLCESAEDGGEGKPGCAKHEQPFSAKPVG
jgi:hypothetical protein